MEVISRITSPPTCVAVTAMRNETEIGTVIFRIPVIKLIEVSSKNKTWEEIINHAVLLFHERHWAEHIVHDSPANKDRLYLDNF